MTECVWAQPGNWCHFHTYTLKPSLLIWSAFTIFSFSNYTLTLSKYPSYRCQFVIICTHTHIHTHTHAHTYTHTHTHTNKQTNKHPSTHACSPQRWRHVILVTLHDIMKHLLQILITQGIQHACHTWFSGSHCSGCQALQQNSKWSTLH